MGTEQENFVDNSKDIDKYLSNPDSRKGFHDDFTYEGFNEFPTCCCSNIFGAILFVYNKITGDANQESEYSN